MTAIFAGAVYVILAIDEERGHASHRDDEPDVRKKRAMIVHHFGQRQQRCRSKRDQEPEQTETDHARFLENGSRDRDRDEKDDEGKTRPEARIIRGGKWIEVVVGGETARPEECLAVEQRHVRLRDQVIVRVRRAGDPVSRRHVLHKQQHRAADHKGRNDLCEISQCAAVGRGACGGLPRKQQTINREEHREDRSGRFGQDRDCCRKNVELIPAQLRKGEVERKRRDHAERRDYFGRRDDVVDRVGVGRVQPVPRRSSKRDPQIRRRRRDCFDKAINDKRQQQCERDEEREDRR